VDISESALVKARHALPDVSLCRAEADALPFPAGSFDCVTCIEVLEHVPEGRQAEVLREMGRVLRTDGTLILRVPHRGAFDWLDSNNLRFRFPRLYGLLVGRGRRDEGFRRGSADVVWHRHFAPDEILELLGASWAIRAWRRGGLLVFPLGDMACWPFYRAGKPDNAVCRAIQRLMALDIGIDYGRASFDLLGVFTKL
jgi:SAM-dependent methyltransferase